MLRLLWSYIFLKQGQKIWTVQNSLVTQLRTGPEIFQKTNHAAVSTWDSHVTDWESQIEIVLSVFRRLTGI